MYTVKEDVSNFDNELDDLEVGKAYIDINNDLFLVISGRSENGDDRYLFYPVEQYIYHMSDVGCDFCSREVEVEICVK